MEKRGIVEEDVKVFLRVSYSFSLTVTWNFPFQLQRGSQCIRLAVPKSKALFFPSVNLLLSVQIHLVIVFLHSRIIWVTEYPEKSFYIDT